MEKNKTYLVKVLDEVDDIPYESNSNSSVNNSNETQQRKNNFNSCKFTFASIVRPLLTLWIVLVFTIVLCFGVYSGKVSYNEFVTIITPLMTMLVGFWFGERSALKDPKNTKLDD